MRSSAFRSIAPQHPGSTAFGRDRGIHTHRPPRSRSAWHSCLHLRPDRCRRESEGPRLLSVWETVFSPIQRERRKGERASRAPQVGRAPGRVPESDRSRQRAKLSFVSGRLGKNRKAIATAAGAHRRRGHAQATAQTSGVAGSLFASLVPGDRDHDFLENDGTLEAAQRIAGHADSRTTKLYDRRGQKVLLEDMERIRY